MIFALRPLTRRCCLFLKQILTICSIFLFFCQSVSAFETYTMGVEDYRDFLPYSSYRNKKYSGLGKDILDLFSREKGYVFKYVVLPLKRRDLYFLQKKLDFIFPDNPYWVTDIKKGVDIAYAPMLAFTDGVVVKIENKGKGLENLKHLGIPIGFTPWQYLDKIKTNDIRVEESNYNGLYYKLLHDRIDGAYVNVKIARYYWNKVEEFKNKPFVFDPDLPHATGYWHVSSIKYPEIIKEFEVFFEENKARIETLKNRYNFYQ